MNVPKGDSITPQYIIFDKDKSWLKHSDLSDKKMADQIEKDVNRSLNHYSIPSFSMAAYRKQLSTIMGAIFEQNKDWSYYQGYNDVCSVFLMTLSENLGYHAALSVSHYYIKDFLKSTFEKGVIPALKLMMKVIQTRSDIYEKISFIDMPTFAVSWIITWFSHALEDSNTIFDYCIASHPATIIYIAAATVIYNGDALLDMEEEDMATVHMIFQNLGTENFDLDEILKITEELIAEYPIEDLLYDNRKIGFEANSPIMDKSLQVD